MKFTSVVGGVIKGVSWDCMIFKDMHLSHVYIIREYPAKHLRQVPSATVTEHLYRKGQEVA